MAIRRRRNIGPVAPSPTGGITTPSDASNSRAAVEGPHGATRFLTKALPKVAAEMALSVLAYNPTRAMNIVGVKSLIVTKGVFTRPRPGSDMSAFTRPAAQKGPDGTTC
jgi:hypothetical protein